MKKNTEKKLDNFLGLENEENTKDNKKIITSRRDLVEKIDRKLVIEDGRQLLREHY